MWWFDFRYRLFNSATLPLLLVEEKRRACEPAADYFCADYFYCGVSEVSSFLLVPPLPCLLDVNSAREKECMPGTLLPPHQTCPSLRFSFTMIYTVTCNECVHAVCTCNACLLHFSTWENGGKVWSNSPHVDCVLTDFMFSLKPCLIS